MLLRRFLMGMSLLGLCCAVLRAETPPVPESVPSTTKVSKDTPKYSPDHKALVYVIPIKTEIGKPVLYLIRRGVKAAIEAKAEFVVIDMNTLGGELQSTLQIMDILNRFPGTTITYVDDDAESAGALISGSTEYIYMSPRATIGSSEPVNSSGQDIDKTMHRKITSFLRAKVRTYAEDHPYRGKVISAMIDPNEELVIDGKTLCTKGELLNLTAKEAIQKYGKPPHPLLAEGIANSLKQVLDERIGAGDYEIHRVSVTWSIQFAQYLMAASPILLGLGGLCLFIEFKTPGFGFFGITGIILIGLVFFGHQVAGLAGHEGFLIFLLGLGLVFLELLVFPGVVVLALSGLLLMAGALLWGMADIWPGRTFEMNPDIFVRPLVNMAMGGLLSVLLIVIVGRLLPKSVFWNRLVLSTSVRGRTGQSTSVGDRSVTEPLGAGGVVGMTGTTLTDLFPSGEVEIGGRRYQARVDVGSARAGSLIRVVRQEAFVLVVEVTNE